MRRSSATLPALLFLLLIVTPATDAASATTITETGDGFEVTVDGYTALVDKPMGNLKGVWLPGGHRILGADTGIVQGASLTWNTTLGTFAQSDFSPDTLARFTADEDTLTVTHPAFVETYRFLPSAIEIRIDVQAADLRRTDDFHFYVGTEVIPPKRQINASALPTYGELSIRDYTTDFMTDRSAGVNSLVSFQSRDASQQRFQTLQLPGRSTWFRDTGHVWIDAGPDQRVAATLPVALPHWDGAHFLDNQGYAAQRNAADQDVIIVHAAHGFQRGDRIHQVIRWDSRGYEVHPLTYPVRTDNGTNNGSAPGRIVVPSYAPPESGYRLLIANHGNTGNAYDNTFMWDFLANDGYIVAASNYTSNAGPNFEDSDFGYNQQVEIEDLRRYVIAHYPIDRDRQYVAGLSLGGLNTFLAGINHPDVYAAMVPQSPVYNGTLLATALGTAPVGTYAFDAGNPKVRHTQIITPTMIVCGTNDLDAVLLTGVIDAQNDHPEFRVNIVPNSGHELWTWEAYRKEVAAFLDAHVRTPVTRDFVAGRFPGAVTGEIAGFTDNGFRLYHENEWLRVGPLVNDTFTRLTASLVDGTARVALDHPATVQIVRDPAWASAAGIVVKDASGASVPWDAVEDRMDGHDASTIVFQARPDTEYSVAYHAPGEEGGKGGRSPGVGFLLEAPLLLVAVLALRGRGKA